MLEVIALESGYSLSITTKSDAITRDIDLLRNIARANVLSVNMTVTTVDESLARLIEQHDRPGFGPGQPAHQLRDAHDGSQSRIAQHRRARRIRVARQLEQHRAEQREPGVAVGVEPGEPEEHHAHEEPAEGQRRYPARRRSIGLKLRSDRCQHRRLIVNAARDDERGHDHERDEAAMLCRGRGEVGQWLS